MSLLNLFPISAAAKDVAEQSAVACMSAMQREDILVPTLEELGWVKTAPGDLQDEHVMAIAADSLGSHMLYGDPPAARWQATWDVVSTTASGVRRLQVVDGASTSRTFMVHPDGPGIVDITTRNVLGRAMHSCKITVSETLSKNSLVRFTRNGFSVRTNPIVNTRSQQFGREPNLTRMQTTYYDREKVSARIGSDFPFVGTIFVFNKLGK
ncbi:MAG: hypothetical protein AAGF55_05875 [Pseudomonadota bacterium]